jgi:hypothetical protein
MDRKCNLCGRLPDICCHGCNRPYCRKHRDDHTWRTSRGYFCWDCVCDLATELKDIIFTEQSKTNNLTLK